MWTFSHRDFTYMGKEPIPTEVPEEPRYVHNVPSRHTSAGKKSAVGWTTLTKLIFLVNESSDACSTHYFICMRSDSSRSNAANAHQLVHEEIARLSKVPQQYWAQGQWEVLPMFRYTWSDAAGHTWLSCGPSCWKTRPASVNCWQAASFAQYAGSNQPRHHRSRVQTHASYVGHETRQCYQTWARSTSSFFKTVKRLYDVVGHPKLIDITEPMVPCENSVEVVFEWKRLKHDELTADVCIGE